MICIKLFSKKKKHLQQTKTASKMEKLKLKEQVNKRAENFVFSEMLIM